MTPRRFTISIDGVKALETCFLCSVVRKYTQGGEGKTAKAFSSERYILLFQERVQMAGLRTLVSPEGIVLTVQTLSLLIRIYARRSWLSTTGCLMAYGRRRQYSMATMLLLGHDMMI